MQRICPQLAKGVAGLNIPTINTSLRRGPRSMGEHEPCLWSSILMLEEEFITLLQKQRSWDSVLNSNVIQIFLVDFFMGESTAST